MALWNRKFDASDPDDVEELRRKAELCKLLDKKMWDVVLDTYEGRYVINFILETFTHPYELSFDENSERLTVFREGERNVGNAIIAHAFKETTVYSRMRREHSQRLEKEKNNA